MPYNPADIVVGDRSTYDGSSIFGDMPQAMSKQQLPCTHLASNSFVIVTLGQSNAANFAAGNYAATGDVVNFSLYDGACYRASDPLIGASGLGGNFATRLGDVLITRGFAERVVLAPIAMGNTRIEHWSAGGLFNKRITVLIRRMWEARMRPDVILWQHGEGNSSDRDLFGAGYARRLLEIVRSFRDYGISAPFMIAHCTISGAPHPNPFIRAMREFWRHNIRNGQRRAARSSLGTLLGPDTDQIGDEGRFDQCHMSENGAQRQAEMWADAIMQHTWN